MIEEKYRKSYEDFARWIKKSHSPDSVKAFIKGIEGDPGQEMRDQFAQFGETIEEIRELVLPILRGERE